MVTDLSKRVSCILMCELAEVEWMEITWIEIIRLIYISWALKAAIRQKLSSNLKI